MGVPARSSFPNHGRGFFHVFQPLPCQPEALVLLFGQTVCPYLLSRRAPTATQVPREIKSLGCEGLVFWPEAVVVALDPVWYLLANLGLLKSVFFGLALLWAIPS